MLKFSARGFTFVELLVVISILGILSAISISAYGNSLKRSRDAKRQTDLRLIQSALEKYRADQGYYPLYIGIQSGPPPQPWGTINSFTTESFTNATGVPASPPSVTKVYLSKYPYDPGQSEYKYKAFKSDSSTSCISSGITQCVRYCLYAVLENPPLSTTAGACRVGTPVCNNGCPNAFQGPGHNFAVTSPD